MLDWTEKEILPIAVTQTRAWSEKCCVDQHHFRKCSTVIEMLLQAGQCATQLPCCHGQGCWSLLFHHGCRRLFLSNTVTVSKTLCCGGNGFSFSGLSSRASRRSFSLSKWRLLWSFWSVLHYSISSSRKALILRWLQMWARHWSHSGPRYCSHQGGAEDDGEEV